MKPSFSKPALSWQQQIDRLEQRGMVIPDRDEAEFYLRHLNYYRLVGYWLPFESDHSTHEFRPGTSFRDVLNLYVFDRELRLLVLDAVERVEVASRSRWAFEVAQRHGPHGYLDPALAQSGQRFTINLTSLQKEAARSDETFIRYFRDCLRRGTTTVVGGVRSDVTRATLEMVHETFSGFRYGSELSCARSDELGCADGGFAAVV